MATTSIWRVNGWLGKVLIYVENPDKTENPAAFEKQGMDGQEAQGLSDVIEYAARQEKTGRIAPDEEGAPVMQRFVSGVNCSPSTARDEMMAVKKRFGKEDGTVAYHGYQSFAPGEATPELAHEIGLATICVLFSHKANGEKAHKYRLCRHLPSYIGLGLKIVSRFYMKHRKILNFDI